MITYPVDVNNTKWAVYDTSTNQVVKRNIPWPAADGSEVILDSDHVLLQHVTNIRPTYDTLREEIKVSEIVDVAANTVTRAYTVKDLDEDVQADELWKLGMSKLPSFSVEREALETRAMIAAILTYGTDVSVMPEAVRVMVELYQARGLRLWANWAKLENLLEGTDTDTVNGWETD
jgi:hypothetical protein